MKFRLGIAFTTICLLALGITQSAGAAITVANQNDSGPGSLRQAIAEAPPGETIVVPAGTYTLTSEPLKVSKSVTISGHGSGDTTIRAGGEFRVFSLSGPLDATISGVTISGGKIVGNLAQGAGIRSLQANLSLRDVVLANNTADANGAPGVSGGLAQGAAIWSLEGSLSVANSTISNSIATAVGGSGAEGGAADGGGIWIVDGPLSVASTTISGSRLDARGGQGPSSAAQEGGVADGAGIWSAEGSLNVSDSQMSDATLLASGGSGAEGGSAEGGGVWKATGPVSITNSKLSGNLLDARGGQGSADENQEGGSAEGGGVWFADGPFNLSGEASSNTLLASGGSGAEGGNAEGGGVWKATGSVSITNSKLSGNLLDARGGQGNSADENQEGGNAEGGGVWFAEGPFSLSGEASSNTLLASGGSGAEGGNAEGGGVWAVSSLATISATTLNGSQLDARGGQGPSDPNQKGGVAEGGGLWLVLDKATAPSGLSASTFSNNSADGSAGSGASTGVAQGGGIWAVDEAVPLSITDSTIASNVARHQAVSGGTAAGGGLWGAALAPGSISLTSLTIAANRLEASGSGFAEGGNLFWLEAVTIRNSIVANGAGPAGSENCSKPPEHASLGFNLESADQCGFHAAGDLSNRDPLLGPLQNNGGPTATMAPAASSPAIDQGAAFGLGVDQRGVVRPIDLPSIANSSASGADGSDIGAFELAPSNGLVLGKLKKNKKKGTATLTVILPQPSAGALTLQGKGLKTQSKAIAGEASVKLKVIGKGAVKKALRKRGKRKVQINVTYAPIGNNPATATRKAKLIRKHRKHKKHPKHSRR